MGLGGYLAGQTEIDHYAGEKQREYQEVKEIPLEEEREIKEILAAYGISDTPKPKWLTNWLKTMTSGWIS